MTSQGSRGHTPMSPRLQEQPWACKVPWRAGFSPRRLLGLFPRGAVAAWGCARLCVGCTGSRGPDVCAKLRVAELVLVLSSFGRVQAEWRQPAGGPNPARVVLVNWTPFSSREPPFPPARHHENSCAALRSCVLGGCFEKKRSLARAWGCQELLLLGAGGSC